MKGLILKEFMILKSFAKTMLGLIALYAILSFTTTTTVLAPMIIVVFSMWVLTSFSYDQNAKWDNYVLTLPITKKQVVISKYIYSLLLMIIGIVIATAVSLLLLTIKKDGSVAEILGGVVGASFISILMTSFNLPLMFKYGPEKARFTFFMIIAALAFIVGAGGYLIKQFQLGGAITTMIESPGFIPIASICAVVVLITIALISYCISLYIYKRKEI